MHAFRAIGEVGRGRGWGRTVRGGRRIDAGEDDCVAGWRSNAGALRANRIDDGLRSDRRVLSELSAKDVRVGKSVMAGGWIAVLLILAVLFANGD
jgi:hypothetical protein